MTVRKTALVTIVPSPMPPYRPLGGALSFVVRNPRLRLYVTGIGLMMLACGLVLGGGTRQTYDA